ncbi:MAG: penicillin-binding protein 1B [Pseudomonadota bacterium]|nr:MAG: penicillin-binding protein 1B [Pseudomonadota bacterium]
MARRPTRKRRQTGRRKARRPSRRAAVPRGWVRRYWKHAALGLLIVLSAYVFYLDLVIRNRFEGNRWAVPAHVYARPLELYVGMPLNVRQFTRELDLLGYRYAYQAAQPGTYSRDGSRFWVQTRPFTFWDAREPAHRAKIVLEQGHIVSLTDPTSGASLSLLRMDPVFIGGIYPAHHEDRVLVKQEEVPAMLPAALVALEDRNFYTHHGVDLRAIARAMWANIRAGGTVQGGSTLTQQLVKNFFLSNERTLWRKANEVVMAVLLELHYDKPEILEAYLNEVYLGQQGKRAIHGFGLASHYYFDREVGELDLARLATLVALVRGPAFYDPHRYPKRLRERRNLVFDVMAEQGLIGDAERDKARQQPLGVLDDRPSGITPYPAFMQLVRRQLQRDYREEDLTSEGLRIFTTLSPVVQTEVETALAHVLGRLDRRQKLDGKLQGAAVVTSTVGGEVLAVVGDRKARFAGFNRALDARRPIGSLVKPAVYLSALEQPGRYTLATPLDDSPVTLRSDAGDTWQPRNYDGKSHGVVPLFVALSRSYNQATVRLGMQLGLQNVVSTLRRLGVEREVSPYPALLLGSLSLSPYEVTQFYQTLAAGGFHSPLRAIREVLAADGEPLQRYTIRVEQVVEPVTAQVLVSALTETMRTGTGRAVSHWLPADFTVAGKTGTTNDLRDSWFAGFSADHVAVVWLGADDNQPTGLTGASGALGVWGDIMARIPTRALRTPVLGEIEYAWVDAQTGLLADRRCPEAAQLGFVKGTTPTEKTRCKPSGRSSAVDRTVDWFRGMFD